jgi:tRNA/tmRNA/rRNA uracil-C5-methylase (TrmA/RlmC/RlmD family)
VSTKSAKLEFDTVAITKLVHGGQGLGELSDGRKVFVWNALPGETVAIRVIKNVPMLKRLPHMSLNPQNSVSLLMKKTI